MDRILIILKKKKTKWPKGFICPCTGVKYHNIQIQYNLIITLSLGSIEADRVISETVL